MSKFVSECTYNMNLNLNVVDEDNLLKFFIAFCFILLTIMAYDYSSLTK